MEHLVVCLGYKAVHTSGCLLKVLLVCISVIHSILNSYDALCRKLNWNVQYDVVHYTNFLSHLLVASKVQTGVCSTHFEKPRCNCREYDGIVVTGCIEW